MELKRAREIANKIVEKILPFSDILPNGNQAIEVVGSVRRKVEMVNDVDILIAPRGALLFDLAAKLVELGAKSTKIEAKKTLEINKAKIEVWFTTVDKWPISLLVRTGGEQSNKDIAKLCEKQGWHLSVSKGAILDGNGAKVKLFNEDTWEECYIETEEDIYKALGTSYVPPEERK